MKREEFTEDLHTLVNKARVSEDRIVRFACAIVYTAIKVLRGARNEKHAQSILDEDIEAHRKGQQGTRH